MQQLKRNLIFGRHPVIDAIQSGKGIDKILLQQGVRGEFEKEIRKYCGELNIPLQYVPKEKLNKINSGNHQGIMAYLSILEYYKIEDVLPMVYEKSEVPLILILDGVTDVRNFGAIARSAECMGAHAIVIGTKGAAQINAEAYKTSAGAISIIPVCREKSIAAAINFLQLSGLKIMASSLKADKQIDKVDFDLPCAIVIGSEDHGVSSTIMKKADEVFIIPQHGKTDSFNVSVATGIILYEIQRQRQ